MFAGVQVKAHPHGGWTHTTPCGPGSTISLYSGNYATEGLAIAELARQKREAAAELMRGPRVQRAEEQLSML